ncbi:hypothetical protein EHO60_05120 [Leptospira fletcheri]|uniref:Uncharacterized protein n=1 Tax=Leptospira fletcheri TaxID=2484981 RepID=A0A4R9GGD3_9LEPT|nr:hypothetical protein EHO60_05120 [Leptospira fletcheri]
MERENLPRFNGHNLSEAEEEKKTPFEVGNTRIIPFPTLPGRNLRKIRELYEILFDSRERI